MGQVFATMTQLLMKQGRVEIDGFGTFELFERKGRRGRNPRTGERIDLPAKTAVRFKPAGALKREVERLSEVPKAENK